MPVHSSQPWPLDAGWKCGRSSFASCPAHLGTVWSLGLRSLPGRVTPLSLPSSLWWVSQKKLHDQVGPPPAWLPFNLLVNSSQGKAGIFCPGLTGSFQLAPCPSTGSTRILFGLVSLLLSFSQDVPGCSPALASLLYKLLRVSNAHSPDTQQSRVPPASTPPHDSHQLQTVPTLRGH